MWTKRTVAVVAVAGLAAAGVAGVAVAAGTDDSGSDGLLDNLVEEGTVTQEDADAFDRVREQFQAEREERRAEREAQRQANLDEIAAAIGIGSDELVQRWQDGESLETIAGEAADEVAALLTQRMQERLAEAEAAIPDRVEALMSREGGEFGGFGRGGHHGGPGGPGGPGGLEFGGFGLGGPDAGLDSSPDAAEETSDGV